MVLQTNGVDRWNVVKDSTAETGGNAGSGLAIAAYSDAGAFIDIPLTIARVAGGPITLSRPLVAGGASFSGGVSANGNATIGSLDGAGHSVNINAVAGQAALVAFQASSTTYWVLGRGITDGSNNFQLYNNGIGALTWYTRLTDNVVVFTGFISAARYDLGANRLMYASGTTYHVMSTPDGADAFYVGSAADPANYHNNTAHNFRNRSATFNYLTLQQNQAVFSGTGPCQVYLSAAAAGASAQLIFANGASAINRWIVGVNMSIGTDHFEIYDAQTGIAAVYFKPISRNSIYQTNIGNGYAMQVINAATSNPFGFIIQYSAVAPNTSALYFMHCQDTVGSKLLVYTNGGIANFQANNTNLSDATLKDVGALLDPRVWWDRLAALEVRAFKYLDQTHDDDNIGLIAQQVQSVAPELVDEAIAATETSPALLGVYTADLFHAHIAVTQELQRRVLALEARLPS